MTRFLPIIFLASVFCVFAIGWIAVDTDPEVVPWYIFAIFVSAIFAAAWGFLGLAAYFVRTKMHKRYSPDWYFRTSFKMAFFIALFVAIVAILAILQLVTTFNVILTILAVSLFALWSYLGKRSK